jgi:hypothetical protein
MNEQSWTIMNNQWTWCIASGFWLIEYYCPSFRQTDMDVLWMKPKLARIIIFYTVEPPSWPVVFFFGVCVCVWK